MEVDFSLKKQLLKVALNIVTMAPRNTYIDKTEGKGICCHNTEWIRLQVAQKLCFWQGLVVSLPRVQKAHSSLDYQWKRDVASAY